MDLGRVSGLLYLVASAQFIVAASIRARMITLDPATTIENVRGSEATVRLGMVADVASAAMFLVTALALYALLGYTDRVMGGAMVVFAALGTALGCAALAHELGLVNLATQAGIGGMGADALREFVAQSTQSQRALLTVTDLTSGLWLLPLGYLVVRSGSFPAAVGVLLIIGGLAWLARLAAELLAPDLTRLISLLPLGSVGEVVFIGWLLVKGGTSAPS